MEIRFAQEMVEAVNYQPRLPIHVLLGEGTQVAGFARQYWKPSRDGAGVLLPGLVSAGKKLSPTIAEEIIDLVKLAQEADSEHILASEVNLSPEKIARADFLESEIEAVLIWHFDDGIEDDNDARLEAVRASPGMQSESIDAKALSLDQLVALARPFAEELDGLGGFERIWLDEASRLAQELRAIESPKGPQTAKRREALRRRNALLGVLAIRVGLVRGAARFVFRRHQEIARKAMSTYERNRRTALNRAKAAAAQLASA